MATASAAAASLLRLLCYCSDEDDDYRGPLARRDEWRRDMLLNGAVLLPIVLAAGGELALSESKSR